MAAKRKGGLKLNAICAKLSRQVVFDGSFQNAEGDSDLVENSEEGSPHCDEGNRSKNDCPEGLTLVQSLEEDQKRREMIEKWVNGEYTDEPQSLDWLKHRMFKFINRDSGPHEGVNMVQRKGCNNNEDNTEDAETLSGSHKSGCREDVDLNGSPHKDDSYQPTNDTRPRQTAFTSGEASALSDNATNTMKEFLHMFGSDDQKVQEKLAKKLKFKTAENKSTNFLQSALSGTGGQVLPPGMDHKQSPTKWKRKSYKRIFKYDLENVKFLNFFKAGEENSDMGGAIAFKTGRGGRPSKYDISNIQKLIPGKLDLAVMPGVLPTTAGTPGTPLINTAAPAGVVEPPRLPVDQAGHLDLNTDYMKSSFSKTDFITTGNISPAKNDVPPEEPESEDVNIYQKYIARYSASQHCGHMGCAHQHREHFHCMDPECSYQRFSGKQDVIRHYNMHKKRDDSLQHGFLRFSPLHDCSMHFHHCHLNGKSTHYHCMQVGCNKVYTSTSDVITHENFHKKNAQLINDGFQRFRATEDCGTVDCLFYGQKTTHFHCRRLGCTFTFKNKCDIEKHKSYHIKDDVYAKDGFKKFYKYEKCKYEGCVYSTATNHFHCIRQGCGFTFTSTSQMTSHKRKHERRNNRSSGALGLDSSLLLPKEKQEESSNDDLMDFTISSKNSSMSASPTSQQSSTVPHLLPAPTSTMSSSPSIKPITSLPPTSRISTLLSQVLPGSMPIALALSNGSPTGASTQFFPLTSRIPMPLTPSTTGLISAADSVVHSIPSDSLPQTSTPTGDAAAASFTPTSFTASSILEKISASKGLISPMMARLATAALGFSTNSETGTEQSAQSIEVKQGSPDKTSGASQDSIEEHSLDLSKRDHSTESNGHAAGNTSQYLSRMMKRSNSELWRTYLRRFDTEDFCEAQCDFLHKTHFHCLVEDCGALFSTLDGTMKHANFHLKANLKVKSEPAFNKSKESIDSALSQTADPVSISNPPLMEVPSRAASGGFGSSPSLQTKKQLAGSVPQLPASMPGMPATFPLATIFLENAKPQVKPGFLQFQENDPCLATDCKYSSKLHFHCLFGNCKYLCKTSSKAESHCLDHSNPNNNLENVRDQFSCYSLQCPCPDQHCEFGTRAHYHCLKPNCCFSTNITTKLPWHIKKHEKAERCTSNGFKYFTNREACGRHGCKYNQVNSHFHCIREGCRFSFLLKHQMISHSRKHMRRMLGKNFDRVSSQVVSHAHQSEEMQHMDSRASSGVVGCHPSLTSNHSSMMEENEDSVVYTGGRSPLGLSSESSNQDLSPTSTPVGNDSSPAGPGCQVPVPATTNTAGSPPSSQSAPAPPPSHQPALQNQPPSLSTVFLRPPLPCLSYSLLSTSFGASRTVVMPTNITTFTPVIPALTLDKTDVSVVQTVADNTTSIPMAAGAKKRLWVFKDMSSFGKRLGKKWSRKMLDESFMREGFCRYHLDEDCEDTTCQFSLRVTHYHCMRENCGYKFCGRTHIFKHAQHHNRVDNLVLDDFKRFKSLLLCNFPDCQFSGNSTHFHCLRCGFRCTDSTKVVAHRKHHEKQDVISAAGFCQFGSSIDCEVSDCKYKLRCSHFHCTYPECKYTVVGMSQMDSHKRKHEKKVRDELPLSTNQDENHQHAGRAMPLNLSPHTENLNSSLNLVPDTDSSLFFLRNAAGLGPSDSMDLNKKMHRETLSLEGASSPVTSMSLANSQDDTTGTSGDTEDDLSAKEEEDDEKGEKEPDEDMNTDLYADSMT